MATAAESYLRDLDAAWQPLREAVEALSAGDWEKTTSSGWTTREMLAHVAFWAEASVPVITFMNRGQEIPRRGWFGSGFQPPEDRGWPPADEHNAREAEWRRAKSPDEVRDRLFRAHQASMEAVTTIRDGEAKAQRQYVREQAEHYTEHLEELRAAVSQP